MTVASWTFVPPGARRNWFAALVTCTLNAPSGNVASGGTGGSDAGSAIDNTTVEPLGPVAVTLSPPTMTVDVDEVGVVVDVVVVDVVDVDVAGGADGVTQPVAPIEMAAATATKDVRRALRCRPVRVPTPTTR